MIFPTDFGYYGIKTTSVISSMDFINKIERPRNKFFLIWIWSFFEHENENEPYGCLLVMIFPTDFGYYGIKTTSVISSIDFINKIVRPRNKFFLIWIWTFFNIKMKVNYMNLYKIWFSQPIWDIMVSKRPTWFPLSIS